MEFTRKSVALVGRPNVGKSRLFNAVTGRRLSIVHDMPGVTRDVVSYDLNSGHTLMDTGGIGIKPEMTPALIQKAAEQQVDFAIEAADMILFVTDGLDGLTPLDEMVAEHLRASGKPAWVVVNKIDGPEHDFKIHEFQKLGLKGLMFTSAEHRRGIKELRTFIADTLGTVPEQEIESDSRIRISFVGRPNVGKSSLCNSLLQEERMIVSDIAGTTRDAISQDLDFQSKSGDLLEFSLIDTAGLRRKTKVTDPVEYFSSVRVDETIARSDVVFLVLDAMEGVTKQDKLIAGQILNKGKGIIVLVNKWDLAVETFGEYTLPGYKDLVDFQKKFEKSVRKEIFFLPDSPILFVSALSGLRVDDILTEASVIYQRLFSEVQTGRLNIALKRFMDRNPPRLITKIRFKVYYAVQISTRPIKFKLFCNQAGRLDDSYKRYLQAKLLQEFQLQGCPLLFELEGKKPPKKFS
ncbi:ribosome biogenesis GTPase Der [Opitutia bacterium ISCC 51]|nr:ribosome biogenesis GTPase Der [Opitutae bacterium ISCC 51]QXD28863.1 ribosome biogenesis GTPase Der [Opitutae bacterium ISCC 52]